MEAETPADTVAKSKRRERRTDITKGRTKKLILERRAPCSEGLYTAMSSGFELIVPVST